MPLSHRAAKTQKTKQQEKSDTTGKIRHNRKNQTQQEKSDTTGKIRQHKKSARRGGGRPDEEEESRARRRRARQGGGPGGEEERVQLSSGHLKEIHSTGGVGQGTTCE
ncbi:hypothetical protein NQD34_011088 [Periophthalmus magnuspinnatus]|nr:hypothetical protein NQD34_011088 [Periophthalmus magnuspinnatus]